MAHPRHDSTLPTGRTDTADPTGAGHAPPAAVGDPATSAEPAASASASDSAAADGPSARPPRLASDLRRVFCAAGVGGAVGVALTLPLRSMLGFDAAAATIAGPALLMALFFLAYSLLTRWIFSSLPAGRLAEAVLVSARNVRLERALGADAMSAILTGVGVGLISVTAILLHPQLRTSPWALGIAGVLVVSAWLAMRDAAAPVLARLDAAERCLDFPGPDAPRTFADYHYVAGQLLTTFGSSDVSLLTTAARRVVTTISTAAAVFNTVVVALVVSGVLGLAG